MTEPLIDRAYFLGLAAESGWKIESSTPNTDTYTRDDVSIEVAFRQVDSTTFLGATKCEGSSIIGASRFAPDTVTGWFTDWLPTSESEETG